MTELFGLISILQLPQWVITLLLGILFISISLILLANKRGLLALVLNGLLVINLWLVIFPPETEHEITQISILTSGTSQEVIEEITQQASVAKPVFVTDNIRHEQSVHIKQFSQWRALELPKGSKVTIYGDGIESSQIKRFPQQSIRFSPAPLKDGISKIAWPTRLQRGRQLVITGQLSSGQLSTTEWQGYSIELQDPTGQTITNSKLQQSSFSLSAWPKANGNFVYQLMVKDPSNKIIFQEAVPLEIYSRPAPKVLLIADAPGFEINRLHTLLENQGIPISSRIKLSLNKYRTSYNNSEQIALNGDLPLAKFNLLIIDERSLEQLSSTQFIAINNRVEHFGLGVLVLLNDPMKANSAKSNYLSSWFVLEDTNNNDLVQLKAASSHRDDIELSTVNRDFTSGNDYQPVIRDSNNNTLVASLKIGKGTAAASRILDSHKLAASSQSMQLALFWKKLIEQVSQPEIISGKINVSNQLPLVDDELTICITASASKFSTNKLRISNPQQEQIQPQTRAISDNQSCARYWPKVPGWHRITSVDLSQSFYVFSDKQWQSARQLQRHQSNQDIANASVSTRVIASAERGEIKRTSLLKRDWLIASLLLLMTMIWLESRGFLVIIIGKKKTL